MMNEYTDKTWSCLMVLVFFLLIRHGVPVLFVAGYVVDES